MKRIAITSTVLLLFALIAAACGDNNDSSDGPTAQPATAATASSPATHTSPTQPASTAAPASPAQSASPTAPLGATAAPTALTVSLSDFKVTPNATSIRAGDVDVTVNNAGANYHSLLFIKTDLPANNLPTDDDGAVDELADGLEVVDEVFEMPGGDSDQIETQLPAGAYVLVCNVVDDTGVHYQLGMRTSFTVTP